MSKPNGRVYVGQRTERHLGAVILYLIKETMSLRDAGGIGRFTQHFIREVLAIARAEVVARGGNALVVRSGPIAQWSACVK